MTTLIKEWLKSFDDEQQPQAELVCNYNDNYYGDQVCRFSTQPTTIPAHANHEQSSQ